MELAICKWKRGYMDFDVIKGKYSEEEGEWSSGFPRKGIEVDLWNGLGKWGHLVNKFSFVVGEG